MPKLAKHTIEFCKSKRCEKHPSICSRGHTRFRAVASKSFRKKRSSSTDQTPRETRLQPETLSQHSLFLRPISAGLTLILRSVSGERQKCLEEKRIPTSA